MSDDTRTVSLRTGAAMPLIGLGTWRLRGDGARQAVGWALEAGYRHVDTAAVYGNEAAVGAAVGESGLARDEVFVTTKLKPDEHGEARKALLHSLDLLGLDAVDLWLLHWPPGGEDDVRAWESMLALRDEGLARAVGVSNFSPEDVDRLIDATGEAPAVNQVKWSPLRFDRERLEHSRRVGTVLEGYSPFKAGNLDDAVLTDLAEAYDVTPAQVVVRWHVEHGIVVIPKSAREERIRLNADVWGFSLSPEEVERIDGLAGKR